MIWRGKELNAQFPNMHFHVVETAVLDLFADA